MSDRDSNAAKGESVDAAFVDSPYLHEVAQSLAQVGTWTIALDTMRMAYSRETYRICGLPYGSPITPEVFYGLVHPEDLAHVREGVYAKIDSGASACELEYRIKRPDGEVRWVFAHAEILRDASGRALRLLGVLKDVTDYKHALAELSASQQGLGRIAAIVEWSSDAIMGLDLDARFTNWNRGATQLFGYGEQEVLGQSIALIVPEGLREEAAQLHVRLRKGEAVERHDTVRRRKDGSHIEVSLTISPIRGAGGDIIAFSAVARDISERRRAETALVRAEHQLREAQKMEAVGLLAGGIAHDFNNLLSVIVGYTELVLEGLSPDDASRSDLLEVRAAGASAVSLTRQLLAFSRRQMLQPRVIDLNQIVGTLERMLRRLIGVHVQLSFELSVDLGRVSADPGQIEQVVMNLVINARDAMPDGGTVTVTTANIELSPEHGEELGLRAGAHVMLAISDTGCGMDAATKSRIWEPFFTTKEKGKGTGLGLPTALGIVQQSKGAIEVDSEPGLGTTFRIFLPRTHRPAQSAYSVPPSRVNVNGSETVLLVEDDDAVRSLARTALRRSGYQVMEAENGEQALRICQQFSGKIHLLLTDVLMPKMSGRELADRVAAMRPDTKVLMMSGYADEDMSRVGRIADGIGVLHKPITPTNLTHKVREVLDT